jgi:hypothetical protein
MEYISNEVVEYRDDAKDIFSGGINAQNLINNNLKLSAIKSNESFERFKDLYIPIGLQQSRHTDNKYFSNVKGGVYNYNKYDNFLLPLKGKVKKNSLNKTKKNKN